MSFLLDTGAAVTLLARDAWTRNDPKRSTKLEPWTEYRLVGVDGSPLQVHGQARVDIELEGEKLSGDVVVVSPLTSEAILGLDFLRRHDAVIKAKEKQLTLGGNECVLPLSEANSLSSSSYLPIRAVETIEVPPYSEMEVMATVEQPAAGVWLLEGVAEGRPAALTARALVTPRSGQVRVRLLNPRPERVKIYKGSKIATLEEVDEPVTQIAAVGTMEQEAVPPGKEAMLRELVEKAGPELSVSERNEFFHLLLTYADVFASLEADLDRNGKLHHAIHTGNAPPIRQPVRRIPPFRRQEVQKLLGEMLAKDVIQRSTSPWASPIVLVKKKDGTTRFCVDYRKLNEVTRKDAYPLPRIDATLDTLVGSRWFSTLDLLSGYWQVEVAERDQPKTAFCTTEGLFEFKVMPFGLCNATATFQRLMDLVLAGLQWSHCLVYLDDVIVLVKTFTEHLENLRTVFARLREAGLKLKPTKCAFLQPRVQYLGHIVSRDGVTPDPAKVEKVAKWPTPTTTKEVQRFLGFASYYRRFIPKFADVAKPLHRLTERGTPFRWTKEGKWAFEELRRRLTTSPMLAYPDFERPFILDTDASDVGIGAVLSQIDDQGAERVIAYGSRVLSKPERRCCVTRRELLAVVIFTKHFRPYLAGRHFLLRTDHASLAWLRNFKEPEGQLARWLERLAEFDYKITHRQGKKHVNADALSRLPCSQCGRESHYPVLVAATPVVSTDRHPTGIREAQLADWDVGPVFRAIEVGEKPEADRVKSLIRGARRLVQLWDQLTLCIGVYEIPTEQQAA